MSDKKIIVGISQGDINGIGLEVIIKSLLDPTMLELCTPVIFGSLATTIFHSKALNIGTQNINGIKSISNINHNKINVLGVYDEKPEIKLGVQAPAGGEYALKSLNAASYALSKREVDVLITAPIDKENIQSDEFKYPGHTEFLEEKFGNGKSLMFLLNDDLRVAVVTGHIPVTKVSEELTTENISKKLEILNESLKKDFLIRAPKIAVLGLNPHAGDNGVIGDEEKTIIIPAINAAKDKNILAYGPFPADGFFGSEAYKNYDAVLAMYHDQGLVPFKTLSFNAGVNYTAGLSVVRTSPDHGTAYDIAGRNIANEASFRKAIYTAIDIYRVRTQNEELKKNPLKFKTLKSVR